jgi:hypothetical protein
MADADTVQAGPYDEITQAGTCSGTVRVWLDNTGKPIRYRLICKGDCPQKKKCQKRSSEDGHGTVREWCSCEEGAPTDCHIVLKTIGRGENRSRAGQKEILCAGGCKDKEERCQLVIVREIETVLTDNSSYLPQWKRIKRGKVIDVRCECL